MIIETHKYVKRRNTNMEKYAIYVESRLFEVSRGVERKDEIVPILSDMYGADKVTAVKLRKNSRLYKEN